jgi:NAD(P)-dependent dehydrogenase (short-subunit alcohol dehydrogenase family)
MKSSHMIRKRVAVVTGCGKENGIGRAIANALSETYIVFATDVAPTGLPNSFETLAPTSSAWQGLLSVVEEISAKGGVASFTYGTLRSPDDCSRMIKEALSLYGRIDVLVNNASAPLGLDVGEIDEVSVEEWDRIMEINARGVFLLTRAVVPSMREQRWGRIISIASIAGIVGTPRHAAYSASKGAVLGFTKSLSIDLAPFGVTVNAVCPGTVLTSRLLADARSGGDELADRLIVESGQRVPVGRHGTPEDIAAAVAFLASEGASYVTGHALTADGGQYRV